jgi:hypothetical protein
MSFAPHGQNHVTDFALHVRKTVLQNPYSGLQNMEEGFAGYKTILRKTSCKTRGKTVAKQETKP